MKKLIYAFLFVFLFIIIFGNSIYADDTNTEVEIAIPDLVVDFDDDRYWYGLESKALLIGKLKMG